MEISIRKAMTRLSHISVGDVVAGLDDQDMTLLPMTMRPANSRHRWATRTGSTNFRWSRHRRKACFC